MKQEQANRTLLEVARSLSIRCGTAQEFLRSRGILGYGPNSLLPDTIVEILVQEFARPQSLKERFLAGVRRALGSASRAESRLRRSSLSRSRSRSLREGEAEDEGASRQIPSIGVPLEESRGNDAEQVDSERDVSESQPESGDSPGKKGTGKVFDELDNLEQLLSRISDGTGPFASLEDGDDEDALQGEDSQIRGEAGDTDEAEKDFELIGEVAGAGGEEDDPFTALERDMEEKTREEFLDESLRELEALLSELGSEGISGQPEEELVAEETEPETSPLLDEAIPPADEFGSEEITEGAAADLVTYAERSDDQADRREMEGDEFVHVDRVPVAGLPEESVGQEEAIEEPESLVSELLDLSALLQKMPGVDSESPEAEPDVADAREPAGAKRRVAVSAQALPGRESVRKWLRRSVVPQLRSAADSVPAALKELAPAQRKVLVGFLTMLFLAVLGGIGWMYWVHRPGGDISLWRSGQELLSADRPDLARKQFSRLTQRYPESPYLRRAMYLLGECFYQEGSYGAALNTFLRVKQLLASRPREIDGLLYPDFTFRDQGDLRIADCYVHEGRFEDGIAIYEQVIARDEYAPAAETAALARAQAFLAWGDREGSPSAYRRAAQAFTLYREKYPQEEKRAVIHWRTGLAYLGLSRTDREHARDHLVEAAVELGQARTRETEIEQWEIEAQGELSLDLAGTYFELSQWPQAIGEYDQLLSRELPPGIQLRAMLGRARALFEAGEYLSAFETASEVAQDARLREMRAEALFVKGDAAWELRRYEEMLGAYEEALGITGGESLEPSYAERAHMRITNVLFIQEKNYEEAAKRYQRIVSRYPNGPYTHLALYRLGCSLFEVGDYDGAAEAFKRSIHDYPQFEHRDPELLVEAYYRTAKCYMLIKSWADAVEALKAALQDLGYPEDERGLQARVDLAACYASLSLYDRAIAILESYLERFPENDREAAISMQLAEYYRSRFDFASARAIHQRVALEHKGKPLAAEALLEEGKDLLAEAALAPGGDRETLRNAAILRFERALQSRPDDPDPVLEIARIYHGEGDFSAAKVYLSRYFELDPKGPKAGEACFLAGETAYSLGAYREAIEHFSRLDPAELADAVIAQASFEQADAYRELGELERAATLFRETARLFPSTEWGKEARWQLDHLAWQERLAKRPVQ